MTSNKRVGLIVGCNWAHTHLKSGPCGYHRAAQELDQRVASLVQDNDLETLAGFDLNWADQAKPAGKW